MVRIEEPVRLLRRPLSSVCVRVFMATPALVALLFAGCLGGQTGTEIDTVGGPRPGTTDAVPCAGTEVTNDDVSAGFSAAQAVALVNRTSGLALDWDSGGVSDLSIRVAETADRSCLTSKDGTTSLQVPVVVVVGSGDGRVDSRVRGSITALGSVAEGLTSAAIHATQSCTAGAPSSWAIACGVSAVEIAGFDGMRLDIAAEVEPAGDGAAVRGTLEVFGARGGRCVNGTCSGPIWESIERASFSSE